MRVPPSNSRGLSALEISGGILKNDDISAAAFHRFISQPASGRSSALPCLAAILVLSEIWRLLRLHGLFFGTRRLTQIFCRVSLNSRHRHGYYHHLIFPPTNDLPGKILQSNYVRSLPQINIFRYILCCQSHFICNIFDTSCYFHTVSGK